MRRLATEVPVECGAKQMKPIELILHAWFNKSHDVIDAMRMGYDLANALKKMRAE